MNNTFGFVFLILLHLLPIVVPISLAVTYRARRRPPVYALAVVLALGFFAFHLFLSPGFIAFLVVPYLAGLILCFLVSVSFFLRLTTRLAIPWSYGLPAVVALTVFLWTDRRLTIRVVDPQGQPTDVFRMALQEQDKARFFDPDQTDCGRVEKGNYRLGLIRWARQKDRWTYEDAIYGWDRGESLSLDSRNVPRFKEWPVTLMLQPYGEK